MLQAFDKWAMDFVVLISPRGKKIGACYIITMIDYLTRLVETQLVKDCSVETSTKFTFEYILS